MSRETNEGRLLASDNMTSLGLSKKIVKGAIDYTVQTLDAIDGILVSRGEVRLARLLELANLSAIVGNLFRGGIEKHSDGRFEANGPHKYPDILSTDASYGDIEIKVALEKNNPKGHLVKPGPHIVVRYVLGEADGSYTAGKETRGDVVWIWEVRVGELTEDHFNVSNTPGDSGKTAVINRDGITQMSEAYCDIDRCPYPPNGRIFAAYRDLFQ